MGWEESRVGEERVERRVSIGDTLHESMYHVTPAHANPLGMAHGGVVLSWMVDVATVAAMRLAQGPAVLAGMDNVFFLNPVRIGWNVLVTAWISLVGRSSMETTVMVEALDPSGGRRYPTSLSHMTLVKVDENLRPQPVGVSVVPSNKYERALQEEARRRRRARYQPPPSTGGSPSFSEYAQTLLLVNPQDTLAYDVLHASRLLKAMDETAAIAASLAVGGPVVTAALDSTSFLTPVWRGEVVRLEARITGAWRSSVEVEVRATALNPGREERLTTTSYFTLVRISGEGKPEPIPPERRSILPDPRATGAEDRRRRRLERLEFARQAVGRLRPPGRGLP